MNRDEINRLYHEKVMKGCVHDFSGILIWPASCNKCGISQRDLNENPYGKRFIPDYLNDPTVFESNVVKLLRDGWELYHVAGQDLYWWSYTSNTKVSHQDHRVAAMLARLKLEGVSDE